MLLHELTDASRRTAAAAGCVIELHEHRKDVDGMRRTRIRAAIRIEATRRVRVLGVDGDPTLEVTRLFDQMRRRKREQLIEVLACGGPGALLIGDARAVVECLLDERRLRMLRDKLSE